MMLVLLLLGAAATWLLLLGVLLGLRSLLPGRKTLGVALGRGQPGDPSDLGLTGTPVTFDLQGGIESPGWLIQTTGSPSLAAGAAGRESEDTTPPETNARSEFNVLIVHGFSDSRFGALRWAPIMAKQVARGGHVVVFDQRGHGEAGGKWFRHGAVESDDVRRVLDQAQTMIRGAGRSTPTAEPIAGQVARPAAVHERPWILLGLSAGGGVSLRATVEHEAEARARGKRDHQPNAEPDPPANPSPVVAGVILDGAYRHWDQPLREILKHRRYPIFPTLALAGIVMRIAGADTPQRFDRVAWAQRLPCPLLVLHGDQDSLCPLAGGRDIAEAAAANGSPQLVTIKGGHHLDLHSVDQAQYETAISAFLRQLNPRA